MSEENPHRTGEDSLLIECPECETEDIVTLLPSEDITVELGVTVKSMECQVCGYQEEIDD